MGGGGGGEIIKLKRGAVQNVKRGGGKGKDDGKTDGGGQKGVK
jgi:hypothetical protein